MTRRVRTTVTLVALGALLVDRGRVGLARRR